MLLATTTELLPNGHRLRVARLGSGPPLVLLHGYPENLQIWCAVAPALADRFTVIAFDWPGMGYSDPWSGGATPFHMADRLLALLDRWGLERASLAGFDMGGQPALAFAARYPARVNSLVVMNSLVQWDEPTSWEIRVLRKFGWNRLILRRLPGLVFRRAEGTFLPDGARLPPELRADFWTAFRRPEVREVRRQDVRRLPGDVATPARTLPNDPGEFAGSLGRPRQALSRSRMPSACTRRSRVRSSP